MTSSDRLMNRTRRGLPGRLSSLRNSVSGTTSSNRPTDATYFYTLLNEYPYYSYVMPNVRYHQFTPC